MKIQTLKDLLAVQTVTNREHPMVAWLVDYIVREISGATVTVDPHRNVYVTKGGTEDLPCVAAHIDTVQEYRNVAIVQEGTRFVGYDMNQKRQMQCGIGADDKTGIFVCLELLKRFKKISAVFFAGEECGTIGARAADPAFFKNIGYMIEWDCPSRNMVSYSCGGERLFMNGGDFIKTAEPVLTAHGSTLWQHHPYTDVMTIRRRFPISCLNLSSGYYNWHAPNEFASLPDVELAIEVGHDVIKALDHKRYSAPISSIKDVDVDDPLVSVGPLYVPEALR